MQKVIPWASPKLFSLEKKLVLDALNSNWISGGHYIDKFENSLKKYLKTKYAFLVTNGTSALHLAYLACDLKRNDEILIPAFGYLAAANIAMLMGRHAQLTSPFLTSLAAAMQRLIGVSICTQHASRHKRRHKRATDADTSAPQARRHNRATGTHAMEQTTSSAESATRPGRTMDMPKPCFPQRCGYSGWSTC